MTLGIKTLSFLYVSTDNAPDIAKLISLHFKHNKLVGIPWQVAMQHHLYYILKEFGDK